MKTIASFNNPIEAEMACAFLRDEGFAADLTNLAAQAAVLGAFNPLSTLELKVPVAEVDEAVRCLRAWRTAPVAAVSHEENPAAAPAEPERRAAPRYIGYDATDWNARERRVERAYRCTILGPLIPGPFVTWYGMYCLVLAWGGAEPLRFDLRRKLRIATVVGSLLTVAWLVLGAVVLARW